MVMRSASPVLAVSNLELTSCWFADVLNCELVEIDAGNWVFATNGSVTFRLGSCPDEVPASSIGDHSYVAYITVDDVEELHRQALRHGATVLQVPLHQPWGRIEMVLATPDGHRLMVAQ